MKRQARNIGILMALMLLAALPQAASAEEGSALTELNRLIGIGIESNPELKRMRAEAGVLEARTEQAGLKQDPKLSLALANFPAPKLQLDDTPMTQAVIGFSRFYESHGKRKLRKKLAAFDEELLVNRIAAAEWTLAEDISAKYFDILRARARLDVIDENIKLVDLISRTAEGKYGIGLTPQSEALRAQLQRTRLESSRVRELQKIETATAMLEGLLGHPAGFGTNPIAPDRDAAPLTSALPAADNLHRAALERRPDFALIRLQLEKQDTAVTLAERAGKRDYTLNASYGARWGKRDFVSVGVAFPLFTSKGERQDALVEEKRLEGDVLEGRLDELQNMFRTRIETDLAELRRLNEQLVLYREGFIPQAELALESHVVGFGAEGAQFESLLKTQELLLDLKTDYELMALDRLELLVDLMLATAGGFDPAAGAEENHDD